MMQAKRTVSDKFVRERHLVGLLMQRLDIEVTEYLDPNAPPCQETGVELAAQLCPPGAQIEKIASAFGLDPADGDAIRATARESLTNLATLIESDLGPRGLQIFLQRIGGAFVSAAVSAGHVCSNAISEAQRLTSRLLNDDRDEDRGGPAGFDDRAQRKREYAAERAVQAHATLVAAEGAVAAYAHMVGEAWKPYVADNGNAQSLTRGAAAAQMAAFS